MNLVENKQAIVHAYIYVYLITTLSRNFLSLTLSLLKVHMSQIVSHDPPQTDSITFLYENYKIHEKCTKSPGQ